jgi:small subunit ribosomal protein S17
MPETTATTGKTSARKTLVGDVVSTKMQKTIIVEVTRKKSHHLYGRVIARSRRFYAHDEKNIANVGDVVRLEETRPMSKLKRWRLRDVIRRAKLVGPEAVTPGKEEQPATAQ